MAAVEKILLPETAPTLHRPSVPILEQLAPNLWTTNLELKILGAELGHRMAVVRLADGSLWVHSPIRWSPELAAELKELGPVRDLVVPSRFHDSWMPRWFSEYQDARIHVAPGVTDDHHDWPASLERAGAPLPEWAPELDLRPIRGVPMINEYAFFHIPSRTLIVSDLLFYFPRGSRTGWTRTLLWLDGAWGELRCTRVFKFCVREARSFGRSLEEVRLWDFDRVIPGHGSVLETGGKAAFDLAFPPQSRAELSRKKKKS